MIQGCTMTYTSHDRPLARSLPCSFDSLLYLYGCKLCNPGLRQADHVDECYLLYTCLSKFHNSVVSRRRDVEKVKMRDWVSFTSTKRQLYLLTLIINHKHGKFIFSGVTSRDCNIFSLKLTDYRVARQFLNLNWLNQYLFLIVVIARSYLQR